MFPPEVFIQIFQEIRGPRPAGPYVSTGLNDQGELQYAGADKAGLRTLSQLSFTCKGFQELAEPLLYQHFNSSWSWRSQRGFLRTIKLRQKIGRHVVRVSIPIDSTSINCLLKACTRLEQLVLVGRPLPVPSRCGLSTNWLPPPSKPEDYEKVFTLLQKHRSLRYLCLISAPNALQVPPPISTLQELRIFRSSNTYSPTSSPNSRPSSLITLHISYSEHGRAMEPAYTFRHLEHIALRGYSPPPFIVALLSQASNLKTLRFDVKRPYELLTDLPERKVHRSGDHLPALQRINIDVQYERLPSYELVEATRQLFFDYRPARQVHIHLTFGYVRWNSLAEHKGFTDHVTETWSMEGTEVDLKFRPTFLSRAPTASVIGS